MRTIVLSVCVVTALGALSPASAQMPVERSTPASVRLPGTEQRSLTSKVLGQDFQISVMLPWSYGLTQKRYPTLYLADADTGFGLAWAAYQAVQLDAAIPEMIVIGIGYGVDFTKNEFAKWSGRRGVDFTPTPLKNYPGSGGAARFARFIREELIPLVERTYRTDPGDRTLVGGSFSGLVAVCMLLEEPGTFQQYIARSPSLWWDNNRMLTVERAYAQSHKDLPVTLFTSLGTLETEGMQTPWREFITTLEGRKYAGPRLVSARMADAEHATAIGMALYPGLKAVFGGMRLESEISDRLVGRYELSHGGTLTISREDQELWAEWSGLEKVKLVARTPTRFSFTSGQPEVAAGDPKLVPLLGLERIDFVESSQGSSNDLVLHVNGQSTPGKRVR